jgi:hypothetical protein
MAPDNRQAPASKLYQGPLSVKRAFTNKNSHPLVLDLLLLKEFGKDYLGWEPETCWVEIGRTWSTTISDINKNKIQAVRTCHVTDQAYERWEVFEKVAMAFLGLPPRFDLIQKCTPHRASVALEVMAHLRETKKVSKEVHKYIAACMLDYGMVYGPGPLEACNEYTRSFAKKGQQEGIKVRVIKGATPKFDGSDLDDIQVMKSLSVKDFNTQISKMLLEQLKRLLS